MRIKFKSEFILLPLLFMLAGYEKTLVLSVIAATIHELGHLLSMRYFNGVVECAEIGITGVNFCVSDMRMSYKGEFITALAGPAASFLFAMICAVTGKFFIPDFFYPLAGVSLVLGAFNILPVKCLDGGRALFMIAAHNKGIEPAERISSVLSITISIMLMILGIACMCLSTGNITLLICGTVLMCYSVSK